MPGFPGRHAIRTFDWKCEPESAAFHIRLLLLLTNQCASLLLEETNPATPGEKQRLFISHAKLDGRDDAERIRKRLDETDFGIEPFVDTNDLTAGELFTKELDDENPQRDALSDPH